MLAFKVHIVVFLSVSVTVVWVWGCARVCVCVCVFPAGRSCCRIHTPAVHWSTQLLLLYPGLLSAHCRIISPAQSGEWSTQQFYCFQVTLISPLSFACDLTLLSQWMDTTGSAPRPEHHPASSTSAPLHSVDSLSRQPAQMWAPPNIYNISQVIIQTQMFIVFLLRNK